MAGNILDVGVRFHATQSEIDKMLKKVESAFSEIDISSSFGKEFEKTYKRMLQLQTEAKGKVSKPGGVTEADLRRIQNIYSQIDNLANSLQSSTSRAPLMDLGATVEQMDSIKKARMELNRLENQAAKAKNRAAGDAIRVRDNKLYEEAKRGSEKGYATGRSTTYLRFDEKESLAKNLEGLEDQRLEFEADITVSKESLEAARAELANLQKTLTATQTAKNQKIAARDAMQRDVALGNARDKFLNGNKGHTKDLIKNAQDAIGEVLSIENLSDNFQLQEGSLSGLILEQMLGSPAKVQALVGQNAEQIKAAIAKQFLAADGKGNISQDSAIKKINKGFSTLTGYKTATGSTQANVTALTSEIKKLTDAEIKETSDVEEARAKVLDAEKLVNDLSTFGSTLSNVTNQLLQMKQRIDAEVDKSMKPQIDAAKDKYEQAMGDVRRDVTERPIQALQEQRTAVGKGGRIAGDLLDENSLRKEADAFKAQLQQSVKHWMGAQQVINLVKQGVRRAYQDIQGLDKAMTNIAVVTDFSVSDLWGKINEYMSIAQQYGVTTQGVYEVSQLYFQQGLGEAETMELTTETLKMARIAGMDYADAADGMTVAIRGFKMEMEDAARVTDVYSKVAAVTASDSQEIIEAMSKTASSAASVGSGFEETTAMLAVMIEATREAPTNIGSAMKSIISRYGEMTKGMTVDTDGEEIAFNKVDTALQSVGVSIKDATGQFREFDDVIYELAGKWETLDSLSQRYVATVFAGNRQQSRFLALMSNYDRLVEVTEDAQNSEDAGLLQYSKTLDSLETKLNNIKTSFQQFYMDIFNGPVIGAGLEFINNLIKGFNKLGKITSIFNIVNIVKGIKQLANIGVNSFSGIGSSITQSIKNGFSQATLIAFQAGKEHKQAYQSGWNNGAAPTTQNQTSVFAGKGKALVNMAVIGGGALSAVGSAWSSKNAIAGSITSGIGNTISGIGSGAIMGASMGSILGPYGAVIGAAVGGVANALGSIPGIVEAFNNRLQEKADQAAEKAEKSNIKRAEAKERVRGLEDGIKDLEELGQKRFDSDEDMQAWLDANNALFEKFPELAVKFDEAGNSIVSLTSAEAELTAAREAASKAAKQAAADEYDKAVAELESVKARKLNTGRAIDGISSNVLYLPSKQGKGLKDAGATFVGSNLFDIYGRYTVNGPGQEAISWSFMQLLKSGLDFTDAKTASWAVSLKNLNAEQMTSALLDNLITGSVKLQDGLTVQDVIDNYTGIEDSKLLQQYNEKTADLNAANRYVDATRASKIATESTSILDTDKRYVNSDYRELESAYEVIQDWVIEQFSFDENGNKITGEIDSSKVAEATTALADDFVNLYTDLFNSGNIEEFNDLIQKALTGKITESDFRSGLEKLGASKDIVDAYLGYIEDSVLLSPEDFNTALQSRDKNGSKKYSRLTELTNKLTEQNRRDIINNEVEFFEAQLEAGKITEEQIGKYITAYADFIDSLGGDQALIDIFTSGDLTSLEGIQETEKALKEAGWTGTVPLDWATLIPTSVINFTTSYENLMDKTVTSLQEMSEIFDTAAGEMDLKSAQEVAKKLGKDVSIFDETFFTRDGESFFATQEAINLLKEEQANSVREEAADYRAAIDKARKEIKGFEDKDELLKEYGDTASTAVAWAKENGVLKDTTKTVETLSLEELQSYIDQYYAALDLNIKASSEDYIKDLTDQLDTAFALQEQGRKAKKDLIKDAFAGTNIAENLQEQAYSLFGKLSQDISTSLDETEYALFSKIFGEEAATKYLVVDGAGGWKIDDSKISDFITNYQSYFGTFITDLLFNTTTSAEEEIKDLFSNAASFGEDAGRGEVFDENDLRQLLEPILGSLKTEIWQQLLASFISGDWDSFTKILSDAGIAVDSETLNNIKTAWNEFTSGTSRSADEVAKDILQSKYDYISGDLSQADIANMSGVNDGGLKETLVAWSDKIGDWAKLSIEEKLAAVTEVLNEDTSLSELERADELEKRTAELLSKEYGHITSRNDVLEESYNILAETGGKNLTEEQVAALLRAGEKLEYSVTADGYQIVNTNAISKAGQDALAKYYDTLSQNAVKGAEELLGAMAEGTLTGAQIQDYFKELNLDILYEDAQALADGTVESLYGVILNSLDKADINVKDKLQEICAIILDGILNAISSGISSLGAGIEGTLSASDYAALTTKYGLSGKAYKTSRGLQLSAADQQKLISKLYENASSQGMQAQFGDQLWEVWRDSTEDTIDGYTAIEEEIAKAKAGQAELTGETKAYVEALQQARAAAMFDENAVEFAFMEQDATDGLTRNFDKFVDNIDKVKDAFSAFKSGEAIGYQDFYNMMDYMNRFGANGEGTNSFIQQIEKAGYTYEDFVNSVVANTDKWGKVDIGGVAAEMGISVDAAMSGMAEGMEEALKEVAKQQIKYLSALEKMLEAMLILEQVGNIDMSIALDYDGDGNPDKIISDLTQLSEEWESIKNDEKKRLVFEVAIENKFAEIGKAAKQTGKNNIFTHILDSIFGADGYTWENGKLDFSLTDANIQDVENSLVALQTLASKYSEIIGDRELTPLQAQSLASQLMNGLIDEEGNIIGTWDEFVNNILTKLEGTDLDNITLEAPVELKTKVTQAGADSPISIGEDGSISLNDNFTLEQANEFVAEFGIKLVPKEEGSTDLLVQELVGTGAEGEGIDGGETPVKITPQWELADGSAGTLTQAITDAANAEGTTIAPEIPIDPKLFLKEGSTAVATFINDLITLLKGQPFEIDLNADGTVGPSEVLLAGARAVITTLISTIKGENFELGLNADGTVEPSGLLLAGAKAIITTLVSVISGEDFNLKLDANGTVTESSALIASALSIIDKLESEINAETVKVSVNADGTIANSKALIGMLKASLGNLTIPDVQVTVDGEAVEGKLLGSVSFDEADLQKDENGELKITGVKVLVDGSAELLNGEISVTDFLTAVKNYIATQKVTGANTTVDPTVILGVVNGLSDFVENLKAQLPDSADKEVTINLKPVYSEDSLAGMGEEAFSNYVSGILSSGQTITPEYMSALWGKHSSIMQVGGYSSGSTMQQVDDSLQQIQAELVIDSSQAQSAVTSATEGSQAEVQVVADGELEIPEPDPVEVPLETEGEVDYTKGEQEEPEDEEAAVNYTKGAQEEPTDESAKVNYSLGSVETPPDATALVHYKIGSVERPPSFSSKWTGSINNVTGSAFADGNVTALTAGAKLANKTLVGELGPELAVYDGQYHLLGQTGAEFVELPDDALIFNHLQTAGIISGQMKNARAQAFKGRADSAIAKAMGSAMATGNVSGPAFAGGGIAAALAAVRRAKSVWQGLLNSLSAADLLGGSGGGGGGGGGGEDEAIKAHIEDLEKWYNLSQKIADLEREINLILAKRKNIVDGHEYARSLQEELTLLQDQINTQQDLLTFQEIELERKRNTILGHDVWSQFLTFDENGTLQYIEGNETNGGEGTLKALREMVENMSGEEQVAYLKSIGWSYTNTDGEELENEDLVDEFFSQLDSVMTEYNDLEESINELAISNEELTEKANAIIEEIRDNEIKLADEIYNIMVKSWEENIKQLKEQNKLIQEANDAYVEGIQAAVDAERRLYENNTAINDREQLQRQLSLMRRSGGSASEISNLEKELDAMLKDEYFNKQEEAIENIREANERQTELMEQQVTLQEDALKYEKENGVLWAKTFEVMMGTDAEILNFMHGNDPEFFSKQALVQEDMLTEWAKMIGIYNEAKAIEYYGNLGAGTLPQAWETERGKELKQYYDKASSEQQAKWQQEYNNQYGKAILEGKTETEAVAIAQKELYEHIENYKKALEDAARAAAAAQQQQSSGGGGGSSGGSSGGGGSSSDTKYYYVKTADGTFIGVNSNDKKSAEAYVAKKYASSDKSDQKVVAKNISQSAIDNAKKKSLTTGGVTSAATGDLVKQDNAKYILHKGEGVFTASETSALMDLVKNYKYLAQNPLSGLLSAIKTSYGNVLGNITNNNSSSGINIESGAIQVNVQQLNDRYDIDDVANDIMNKMYSIASRATSRGVSRR